MKALCSRLKPKSSEKKLFQSPLKLWFRSNDTALIDEPVRAPTANRLTKAFGGAPQSTRRRNDFIGQSGQPVGRQMCERLLRRATGSANSGTDSRVSASVHTNRRTNSYTYLIRRVSRSTLARKSLSACFIVAPSPLRRPSMRSTVNPIIRAAQLDDIIKS